MVSILKNQLLKHLSRFTKNLSADKINLSTFKGKGELNNLELNEIVLTDLLELPLWLRLQSAWCNKVTFSIQWTQLKKVPIQLNLDEVHIMVETCEDLRTVISQSGMSTAVPGKYSYIHKIIDGITINVNTVNITFNSPVFTANVMISRILVESKSPTWKKVDLRMTRLKESEKGQILIFKELEWQNVKIEAKSTIDKKLTPLRLLTNQARCRIVIKKRLSDSFVLGTRIVVILDDLLWVLTDSQLKAALHFLDSLAGLVEKANNVTRKAKAARKLEELPEYKAQFNRAQNGGAAESDISKIFASCDVLETSYHFLSHKIVLHLSDDDGLGRSSHPNLKRGGALQIVLQQFEVDFYPYHLAQSNRKHWARYKESSSPLVFWQKQALSTFKTKLLDLLDKYKTPQHTPLSRMNKATKAEDSKLPSPTAGDKSAKAFASRQFSKLMTTCVIMRMDDFKVYKVTTSGRKQEEFISGDRDHMSLPSDAKMIHAEFTYFYYPNDTPFPLPAPMFYVQINPVQIIFDVDSCLWFNAFALHLHQSLLSSKQEMPASDLTYIDVKVEAILPRITFESSKEYHSQRDRPRSLTFQVTRATLTNVRSLEQSSRADLAKCVDSFHMGSLFFGTDFPSKPADFHIVTQKFLDHISTQDNIRKLPVELDTNSETAFINQLSRELLWTEAKDVWCITLDPVWGEFTGARASNKAVPFLDALPVTIWLHTHMDPNSTVKQCDQQETKSADIHALAHISNLVSLQINHYQYLFLLRLAEEATELATFLSIDTERIMNVESDGSLVFGVLIPQLEITFVMPSQYPGKESSGGDVESFVPDSSSIADDIFIGSTSTMFQNAGSTWSITNKHLAGDMQQSPKKKLINPFGNHTNDCFEEESVDSKYADDFNSPLPSSDGFVAIRDSDMFKSAQMNVIPNNINAGLSSMKKGFSSLMTSIDSALKTTIEDASDTMSIRSDASSDSENYVVVLKQDTLERENPVDAMFCVDEFMSNSRVTVEIASEVIEEDSTMTSPSDRSLTTSFRRKDLVSVSTFKLNKVEFLQQSVGYSSAIKVQVGNISNEDCISIPWDEFQNKFSSRSRAWSEDPSNASTSARVKVRMSHDLKLPSSRSLLEVDFSDPDSIQKVFRNFLDVQVSDLSMILSMSTVIGLADLAEDEIIPIPLPMQISLSNIQLHLNEDRPPVNITSPGPIPIDMKIIQLFITRNEDGEFQIHLSNNNTTSSQQSTLSIRESDLFKSNTQLRLDNDELQRRLQAFERISEENFKLRKCKEENEVLRSCLASSQDEVSRLLDEKRKLLDELRKCQEQMMVDRNRQWTAKR